MVQVAIKKCQMHIRIQRCIPWTIVAKIIEQHPNSTIISNLYSGQERL